jgi:hypothetical protein
MALAALRDAELDRHDLRAAFVPAIKIRTGEHYRQIEASGATLCQTLCRWPSGRLV